jgi:2-polyprenyl-3-methyl-5-hydroxy-6-metoxy-1,4-benzoquinol methylase
MQLDLSQTYKDRSLKNYPHRQRLKEIYAIIEREGLIYRDGITYSDIGCNDGYITNLIAKRLHAAAVYGFCHSEKIEIGREKYPHIHFNHMELNEPADAGQYDFVTCFETLEHVGDLEMALDNLIRTTVKGGILLITVPIEIGFKGVIKFIAKTIFYHYTLDELPGERLFFKYLISLLSRGDISTFRNKRLGWGTHFGFDYRTIDRYLESRGISYRAKNKVTTRFYIIKP